MDEENIRILIVEDDETGSYLLNELLKLDGYQTSVVHDGESALKKLENQTFNLCLLDIMLPRIDGQTLARILKKRSPEMPVIFITARTLDQDKIDGFKAGCDDYITKPFNTEELLYRIKAVLRRYDHDLDRPDPAVWKFGNAEYHYFEHRIYIDEECIPLSQKESDLLKILCESMNNVVSRKQIMISVWGRDDYYISNSLDVYLARLRKKLSHIHGVTLETIHGYGYKLNSSR